MIDYNLILLTLYLDKQFNCYGTEYDGIIWNDSSPKPSKEELDSQWEQVLSTTKKEQCKTKAKQLLTKTDWSSLNDVQNELENYAEFVTYRKTLRSFITSPVENPIFPIEPETRWKQ